MNSPRESSSFLRASLFLFVIINSGSFFAFLFQWQTTKRLPDTDAIGVLNTLLAFVTFLVIPGQALQLVCSRYAARAQADGDPHLLVGTWRSAWVLFGAFALLLAVLLTASASFLQQKYHLDSPWPLVAVVGLSLIHLPWFFGIGFIQGQQRFVSFGLFQALPYWLKFVFGVGAVVMGYLATGIITSLILAHLVPVVAIMVFLRSSLRSPPSGAPNNAPGATQLMTQALPLLLNFGAFNLLTYADMHVVRINFGGSGEGLDGLYAAAATLARTVFYLPMALVHVTFAKVTEAHAYGRPHRHLLWKSLGLTTGLAGFGALILGLFPEFILNIYGGEKVLAAAPYLRWYLLPSALLGIVAVFMHYYFALGRRSYALIILAGTGAALVMFRVWCETPLDIIFDLAWVSGGVVLVSAILLPFWAPENTTDTTP